MKLHFLHTLSVMLSSFSWKFLPVASPKMPAIGKMIYAEQKCSCNAAGGTRNMPHQFCGAHRNGFPIAAVGPSNCEPQQQSKPHEVAYPQGSPFLLCHHQNICISFSAFFCLVASIIRNQSMTVQMPKPPQVTSFSMPIVVSPM